jgi:ribonuclease HII
MRSSSFDLERQLLSTGYRYVLGIDEAGRGPLAGPVVACAVALKPENVAFLPDLEELKAWSYIRDSKTLSEKKREELYDFIVDHFHSGVGISDHQTIDRINILEATFLAMKKAISALQKQITQTSVEKISWDECIILTDGNKVIPNLTGNQRAIVNGDGLIKSISAASIIAKVTRDRMMHEFDRQFPQYQFRTHKGYGTKAHMEALRIYGPCPIHRKSFEPVAKLFSLVK